MKGSSVYYIIVLVSCLLGCLYQVYFVSQQYFSYKATTRVESQLQDIVRLPALILCVPIYQFHAKSETLSRFTEKLHGLTILELDELTPAENNILSHCWLRMDDFELLNEYSKNSCYKHITVKKVLIGDSVCYQFHPHPNMTYSINQVANAFNYPYNVFEIHLKEVFRNISDMYIPAHYPSLSEDQSGKIRFPVHSRKFGQIISRSRADHSWLIMRPTEEVFNLLPPPFDTDCKDGNDYCLRDCTISKSILRLNKFPHTEPAGFNVYASGISRKLKILSPDDLRDATNFSKWSDIVDICNLECRRPNCEIAVTSNFVYANLHEGQYLKTNSLPFLVLTGAIAISYPTKIIFVAEMNWIEYVSGVSNCLSIWFGISVVAINPLRYTCKLIRNSRLCRNLKTFTQVLYYTVCLVGFLYQSVELCREYFMFKTSMTFQVSNVDHYPYPSLAVCLDYQILLNRSNHKELGLAPTLSEGLDNYEEELSALTIKQIRELTPNADEIIFSCGIRDDTNIGLTRSSKTKCLKMFLVEKVVRGPQVCYVVIPRELRTYSWSKVATSFRDETQVYAIETSIRLSEGVIVTVISYEALNSTLGLGYNLPQESRNFAHQLMLFPDNVVTVTTVTNMFTRLPAPYDTNCRSNFRFSFCLFQCVDKQLSIFKRKPYFSMSLNPYNDKILSSVDIRNKSIAEVILKASKNCRNHCAGYPCQQTVSQTSAKSYVKTKYRHLIFGLLVPQSPTINILYTPSTDPLNFFIYICNCFGIWFGLSMASFNPAFIWNNRDKLICRKSVDIEKKKTKLSSAFMTIFVAGFVWQAYLVINQYFSYTTNSRIEVAIEDIYRYPTINLCARYRDFFTHQSLESDNITVQDLFKLTPGDNETLFGWRYRDITSQPMHFQDYRSLKQLIIEKYIMGANVCYAYAPGRSYSLTRVTSALGQTGIIYELLLSPIFNITTDLSFSWFTEAINFQSTGRAVRSRKFISPIFRETDDNDSTNYFVLQGVNYNISLLPEPYDSKCIPSSFPVTCFSKCYTHFVKTHLNRLPFDEYITEPSSLRMLTGVDLRNSTLKRNVKIGNEYCQDQCYRQACIQYFSTTNLLGYWKPRTQNNGLVIAVGPPVSNGFYVKTYPSFTLIEFLNNLAVSGSIWLGVSVLSIAIYSSKALTSHQCKNRLLSLRKQRFKRYCKKPKISPLNYCSCSYCQKYQQRSNKSL